VKKNIKKKKKKKKESMVAFRVLTFDRNPKEKPWWGKKRKKKGATKDAQKD